LWEYLFRHKTETEREIKINDSTPNLQPKSQILTGKEAKINLRHAVLTACCYERKLGLTREIKTDTNEDCTGTGTA
jgi:hypothetical protein